MIRPRAAVSAVAASLLLAGASAGCGRQREPNVTPLASEYRALIPYRGDERLVLASTEGQRDTLLLRGYTSRMAAATRYLGTVNDRIEHYELAVNSYDGRQGRRIDKRAAIALLPTDTSARLELSLEAQGVILSAFLSREELLSQPDTLLAPPLDTIADVKAIPFASEHSDPAYFADRVYWSVSRGLVGYDDAGHSWRLWAVR